MESFCSKRKMQRWQIIHLTQKINFLPREQYIWFQTIFVLRQEEFHKTFFPTSCTAMATATSRWVYSNNNFFTPHRKETPRGDAAYIYIYLLEQTKTNFKTISRARSPINRTRVIYLYDNTHTYIISHAGRTRSLPNALSPYYTRIHTRMTRILSHVGAYSPSSAATG